MIKVFSPGLTALQMLMDFATTLEQESFEHFPYISPSVCHVVQFLDLTNIVGRCHNFVWHRKTASLFLPLQLFSVH